MFKTILFSTIFVLTLGGVSFAAEVNNIAESNLDHGKEKPKGGTGNNTFDNKADKLYSFSLRSSKQWRGNNLFKPAGESDVNYISLNTSVSYQKGQTKYTVPYKKKVILNRFTFNPNETSRNYTR